MQEKVVPKKKQAVVVAQESKNAVEDVQSQRKGPRQKPVEVVEEEKAPADKQPDGMMDFDTLVAMQID